MHSLFNNLAGLPFWTEDEIDFRDTCIKLIKNQMVTSLTNVNRAWQFFRMEGPILTPREYISSSYTSDDIFELIGGKKTHGDDYRYWKDEKALRAETTASSYAYAQFLLEPKHGFKIRPPACIWQAGKSFRQERSDGATAAKLRFNEFYQLEFQCIYSKDTKADYRQAVLSDMKHLLGKLTARESRIVDSDRLPSYSLQTQDIEVLHSQDIQIVEGGTALIGNWREVASISTRTDYPDPNMLVLEVAIGLDRLVALWKSA